jgi:SagB-type dehydrogenase family enzyme
LNTTNDPENQPSADPVENRDTRSAWIYHDGTKHPDGPLMDPYHRFDPSRQPLLFKIYKDLPALPLPQISTRAEMAGIPALAAISGGMEPAAARPDVPEQLGLIPALDLPLIARLLFFSAGITKVVEYPPPWGPIPFRAAACTGALYHIEIYLVCGAGPGTASGRPDRRTGAPGLEAGVYHFDPQEFALRMLRRGDYRQALAEASGQEPGVSLSPAILVLSDVVWRNAVKYQAREYRHAFWDSGTILANLLAVAAASRLPARLVTGFVDDQVSRLLDLDEKKELPLALVPVGDPGDPSQPYPGPMTPLHLAIVPYSSRETEFPAIRSMQRASSLPDAQAVAAWRSRLPERESPAPQGPLTTLQPLDAAEVPSEPIEKVILRRGSTRVFARRSISFRQLSTLLSVSLKGLNADFLATPEAMLSEAYLIVNAVEGLAPGAYVYHPSFQALELLKQGNFRTVAGNLALYQDLAADASVDIFLLANLPPILDALGNRGYRVAQLEASLAAGRMYLAAYAQGFGASGLTFYDDAVTGFFSPHAQGKSVMFLIALGEKQKRQKI